jgi:O-acetyl-ADP-ribose deacetylase (regulator of RNase III)
MGTLVHHTGDIFTTQSKGIGHGVNVAGVMGHGIAVQFKQRFPDMYSAYNTLCRQGHLLPGETMIWEPAPGLFVYNIASQDEPGRNASYAWLEQGVKAALIHADENGLTTIALPRIGSGIGGLNEREVELLLSQTVAPFKTSIEIWTLPR